MQQLNKYLASLFVALSLVGCHEDDGCPYVEYRPPSQKMHLILADGSELCDKSLLPKATTTVQTPPVGGDAAVPDGGLSTLEVIFWDQPCEYRLTYWLPEPSVDTVPVTLSVAGYEDVSFDIPVVHDSCGSVQEPATITLQLEDEI